VRPSEQEGLEMGLEMGRVASGDRSPEAPTDPDLPN